MKRQFYVATFLTIIFSAAVVIADFDPEGQTTENVSASAMCGEIVFPNGNRIDHMFDNIQPIVFSSGCVDNVPAYYWISQSVEVSGSTDEFARVKVITEAVVTCSCGHEVDKRSDSKIDNVDGYWDGPLLNFNRGFTVSDNDGWEVEITLPATYTVTGTGKGAAIVGGLSGQTGGGGSAFGFGLSVSTQSGQSTSADATWDEGTDTTTFTVGTNANKSVSAYY